MRMTLSGHTSTLLRLVVWGADFQGNFLDLTKTQKSDGTRTYYNRGRDSMIEVLLILLLLWRRVFSNIVTSCGQTPYIVERWAVVLCSP